MIGTVLLNLLRLVLLLLLQVLVLDHLDVANSYVVPYVYVLFLLMLPFELPEWSTLLIGGAAGIVRAEFIRQARLLAQKAVPSASWLPSDLAVVHGTGATIDVLAWWLEQDEDFPPDTIADILNRLVIAPLVGRMGRED